MSKDSSARHYEKNKKKIQKKSCERYQNLTQEEKKEKNKNIVVNDMRISQKIKIKNS